MKQIAIYGKGGIGKSTVSSNLSATLAQMNRKVVQIGCDPKHDSTRLLLGRTHPRTVLGTIKYRGQNASLRTCLLKGYGDTLCIEAGGPEPGVGCAGRGILCTLDALREGGMLDASAHDYIIYDVLGDVVCGGFAVPLRREFADIIFIVTSGEYMSIYAANNIIRGIQHYETDVARIGGIILNLRGGLHEEARARCYAEHVGLPIVVTIPRDERMAEAEKRVIPYVAAYPDSTITETFSMLATLLDNGIETHRARPLSEDTLEVHMRSL